jgi:hypothetical protein
LKPDDVAVVATPIVTKPVVESKPPISFTQPPVALDRLPDGTWEKAAQRIALLLFLLGAEARAFTPNPSPTPDISVMVARIKAAKATNKPFVIYYEVGKQVTVASANYIALNPSGRFTYVIVFTDDDTANSIPVYLITKLVLVTNYPFD